ncbi:helix-turn-helix transcriptional regulator [Streptomyces chrestomyceticus]|uniref:helix-turn-helix transcriptional regulator n=1 Tax=Streptomyces chrestomyceticus TaxID=68185 RepID=UPI0033CA54AD
MALRQQRLNAKLSAAQLAARLGTSKATILNYENGKRVPEAQRVAQLADALGLPSAGLLVPYRGHGPDGLLTDLRRLHGWTAEKAAAHIGVSRSTYRRIEREARLPSRGGGTIAVRLANAFGVPAITIAQALYDHPAAAQRRAAAARHIRSLFDRAHTVHTPAVVTSDEPDLLALAALTGQPAGLVCRLVNHELSIFRDMVKTRGKASMDIAYAQSDWSRVHRKQELQRLDEQMADAPSRTVDFLLHFLAEAMTFRQWRVMVHLARASMPPDRSDRNLIPAELDYSFDPDAWPGLLDRHFLGRPLIRLRPTGPNGGSNVFAVTPIGLQYYEVTRDAYAHLYPRLYAPSLGPRIARYSGRLARTYLSRPPD